MEGEMEQVKITFGAFVNGKMMTSITVNATPKEIEMAKRFMANNWPDAQIYRKL
jgi:hypothetical protein